MGVRSLGIVTGLLTLAVLVPADSAAAVEVVKDGGFESTSPIDDNPNWDEGWILIPPICDVDTCGDGSGTAGPRTGKNWAWFGGSFNPEEQFLSQSVTIPSGAATLTFYLWLGNSSGNGQDAFRVFITDMGQRVKLFEALESSSEYGSYTQVSMDVSRYAGGGARDLSFEFEGLGGPIVTNFSVDDISLQSVVPVPKTVTLKGPKSVAEGRKAKLKATVAPCAGHEGDTIELYRGKKKIASAASDNACKHTFKVKVTRTSTFRAVSPKQGADDLAGTSKKRKVRAK